MSPTNATMVILPEVSDAIVASRTLTTVPGKVLLGANTDCSAMATLTTAGGGAKELPWAADVELPNQPN